jgi:hypothetical protein
MDREDSFAGHGTEFKVESDDGLCISTFISCHSSCSSSNISNRINGALPIREFLGHGGKTRIPPAREGSS